MSAVIIQTETGYQWKLARTEADENRLAASPGFLCVVSESEVDEVIEALSQE